MILVLYFIEACALAGFLWLMVLVSRWTAPLSGIAGLATGVIGVYVGSLYMMGWGFGLFVFSAFLFTIGGGMER